MIVFVLNFFAYFGWAIYAVKKSKGVSIYSILVAFYACIAFFGVVILNNGIYKRELGFLYNLNDVPIIPYVLCFVCYMMFFNPLKNVNNIDFIKYDLTDSKVFKKFVPIWCVLSAIYMIFRFFEMVATLKMGLANAYNTSFGAGETLFYYPTPVKLFLSFLLNFEVATVPLIMVYSVIGWQKKNLGNLTFLFLVALCLAPGIFVGLANGSRGHLFLVFFDWLFFGVVVWKYLSYKNKKKIKCICVLIICLMTLAMWAISSDRASDTQTDALTGIIRYFGESFPNLGLYYWNHVDYHPMGERLFSPFLENNLSGYDRSETYYFWGAKVGVLLIYFKTLFGDLYIEFGPWLAVLFVLIFSFFFSRLFKKRNLTIVFFPIVYLYFHLCIYAFAGFYYGDKGFVHQIIFVLITVIILSKGFKGKGYSGYMKLH